MYLNTDISCISIQTHVLLLYLLGGVFINTLSILCTPNMILSRCLLVELFFNLFHPGEINESGGTIHRSITHTLLFRQVIQGLYWCLEPCDGKCGSKVGSVESNEEEAI